MKRQGIWIQLGLAALVAMALACGGVEEPGDSIGPDDQTSVEVGTSEAALRKGGGLGGSCSASGAWCYDPRNNHWDIDNGCSISCPNGGGACLNAFCGGDGSILFPSICRCGVGGVVF